MSYAAHFTHADDVIQHLDTVVPNIGDPLLEVKYVGFVAVAAVTVYELAVKEIFITFAGRKHNSFKNYMEHNFSRINGRIKLRALKEDYTLKCGDRYSRRFKKELDKIELDFLSTSGTSVCSAYSNIILWRHKFAHKGHIGSNATYSEAVRAYHDGKEVLHCLNHSMRR